jgi:hypothetical protein
MGWLIYIADADAPGLWDHSTELPETYLTKEAAEQAIEVFSDYAADQGFHYPVSDFKVVEEHNNG